MSLSQIFGDFYFPGSVTFASLVVPANAVTNTSIVAAAGLSASKLEHQYEKTLALSVHATSVAVIREGIHRVKGATATLIQFGVYASVAATSSGSATIDLLKNGTTILSATITLDAGTAAYTLKEPSGFTSTALVTTDCLEVNVSAVSGSVVAKGVCAYLVIREDAQ